MNRFRKIMPAVLGILALFLGAWSFAPRTGAAAALAQTTPVPTSRPLSFPPGLSENEKALIQSLYDFNPDISLVTSGSLVGSDRTALDVMWAQNYNMLQMLRVAMDRTRNAQLRAEVRLLYQMRLKDQQLLNQLEAQVGPVAGTATATLPPTMVGTPTTVNTPTMVPSLPPTETATAVVTSTTAATAASTEQPTTAPTSAATAGSTEVATAEATSTAGATASVTATAASPTEISPTAGSTETAEANVVGGSGNVRPISLSNVPVLPGTALGQLGFRWVDLNAVFLNMITHVPDNQFEPAFVIHINSALSLAQDTAQTVQTTSTNSVLQAVAKHLAQEDALDQLRVQVLVDRVFFGQSLRVRFPNPPGVPGQPTPVGTASATAVSGGTEVPSGTAAPSETAAPLGTETPSGTAAPSGTGTPGEQSQQFEIH